MQTNLPQIKRLVVSQILLSVAAAGLLAVRLIVADSTRFRFLVWNLFLAWIPLVISFWFIPPARTRRLLLTTSLFIAWLLFLPNTFYIVSDLIHLRPSGRINVLYDAVMLFMFSLVGMALGLASLHIMHGWLRRKLSKWTALAVVQAVILLCSFAIYLGRYLRWNSWDIILSPLGILVDISDRFIAPLDHPRTLSTTFIFYVLISSVYLSVLWLTAGTLDTKQKSKN